MAPEKEDRLLKAERLIFHMVRHRGRRVQMPDMEYETLLKFLDESDNQIFAILLPEPDENGR